MIQLQLFTKKRAQIPDKARLCSVRYEVFNLIKSLVKVDGHEDRSSLNCGVFN